MKKLFVFDQWLWAVCFCLYTLTSCGQHLASQQYLNHETMTVQTKKPLDTATFAEGCFWCTEAFFQQLDGVVEVIPGYTGGHVPNPTYEMVCSDTTGHAEACNIIYDPEKISYEELLKAFWYSHDPTQLNRQGNDVGSQYRSAIFYHNDYQRRLAETYKKRLDASGAWDKPIVTTIEPYTIFYPAEDYHRNYYNRHPDQPYCQFVIRPKLEKFEKVFKDKLKNSH